MKEFGRSTNTSRILKATQADEGHTGAGRIVRRVEREQYILQGELRALMRCLKHLKNKYHGNELFLKQMKKQEKLRE